MRRFSCLVLIAAGLVLHPSISRGDENREILLYLAPSGLVALEFRVTVDGKPFQETWDGALDERFRQLDKNQDGEISGVERNELPNPRLLRLMNPDQFNSSIPHPAKMDRKGFGEYMEKLGFEPFKVNLPSAPNQNQNRLVFLGGMQNDPEQAAKLLFAGLDRDSDGRLSQTEMEQAPASLAKQDLDQDETISSAELVPTNYAQYFVSRSNPAPAVQSTFLKLDGGPSQREAVKQLTAKYDTREKDNALSREEVGVPEKLFGEHDIDGNGKWDFEEIQQYLKSPTANVIVRIQLGTAAKPAETKIEFEHGEEMTSEVKNALGSLNLDNVQMEVSAQPGRSVNLENVLKGRFQSIDQDNNGYWDKDEVQNRGAAQPLFQELDRDKDEKLFFEEFSAGILPVAELTTRQIQLGVTDRGKDLFRILDANGDGRLSIRELWAMPERAALWDKDGDGAIALSDVPQQYRLVAVRGDFNVLNRIVGVVLVSPLGMSASVRRPTPSNGPVWFQRMDRNSDGDVSRKEFLGTAEDFQKLDEDGDGLISAEEAGKS